jgi:hypothetical protein
MDAGVRRGLLPDSVFKQHSVSSPGLTGRSSIPETAEFNREASGMLDAPVKPGHDSGGDVTPHSRGTSCPSDASSLSLERQRAQGKPDARSHPQPRVRDSKRRKHTSEYRYAETFRPSLRNGFAAYGALSPVSGLFSHRRSPGIFGKLDPSIGRSGPHAFAVRIGRVRQRRQSVHRIPHPTFVTIAKRPSVGAGHGH